MDIIEVRKLTYSYPASQKPVLKDVSLKIKRGEFCAIIGANDSGKTTLCSALRGFIPHFHSGQMEGDVFIKGENTRSKNITQLSSVVGIVIQNPFNQISGVSETVYEEIAFGLENLGVPVEEIRRRVDNLLKAFNLEKLKDRNPFELSGGQQQIVSLASIMAMEPEILVLDEPTSQVDPATTDEIFKIIDLCRKKGTTIVLVEHKTELLAEFADHIVLLDDGSVVMDGKPADILANPEILHYNVNLPLYVLLGVELKKRGVALDSIPITERQAATQINKLLKGGL